MKKAALLSSIAFATVACHGFYGATAFITEDMTSAGDWEVTVPSGETNVVTAAQSGSGRIIKKGAGYLVLRKNSTFSGGVEIREGFLLVDPDSDAGTSGTVNCTALGSGAVTICGQTDTYSGYCELGIVGAASNDTRVVTIANAINVTGTSDGTYPALTIYGQNSALTGKITAAADFVFIDDFNSTKAISNSQYNRFRNVQSCTFGEIEAAGSIGFSGACRMVFMGKVKTPTLDLTVNRAARAGDLDSHNNNTHGALVFHAVNEIGKIVDANRPIYCAVDNALPDTLFHVVKDPYGLGLFSYANLNMYGYDNSAHSETIGGLSSDPLFDGEESIRHLPGNVYEWAVDGKGSKILTITGVPPDDGAAEKELVSCIPLQGAMSLTLDSYDGFTQTISNQLHKIAGSLTVKKGTLRVAGTAKFTALQKISVHESAVLDVSTVAEDAFPAVTEVVLDGKMVVSDKAAKSLFPKPVAVSMGKNATLSLPSGFEWTMETLTVDGVPVAPGIHTSADLPMLGEGATLNVLLVKQPIDVVWTGAAESDNLIGTPGNWQNPPASFSAVNGTVNATIAGNGNEMVYEDGTMLGSINVTRTPASVPFTIRPASAGDVLSVAGKIVVTNAGQIILQGTIATPSHIDQGLPERNGKHTMCVIMTSNDLVKACSATNNVYLGRLGLGSLPVVLDNVTIEKPVWSTGLNGMSGFTPFYCMPNTANEIKGAFHHQVGWPCITTAPGSSLVFSGGMEAEIGMRKDGSGTMSIRDKPFTSVSYLCVSEGTLILDAENLSLRGTYSGEGLMLACYDGHSTIDFRRSYCLDGDCALMIYDNANAGLVEFNSTTQRVTRLAAIKDVKGTQMRGDVGSLLEVVGGRTDMTFTNVKSMNLLTNRVDIAGALSFRMSATNETMTFYSQDFSTSGDLEVSAGTLDFRSDATWLNGRNVAVNGEGRLKIGQNRTFDWKKAGIDLDDAGVIEVPHGISQKFRSIVTNGVALPAGKYASLPNGEGDFIAGGGEIVVPIRGLVFSVR